jgi:hypothetical protein
VHPLRADAVFIAVSRVAARRVRDDERESLRLKISMAKAMLANLRADVPRRDTVVAAMKEIIADAENQLDDAGDDEAKRG